MTGFGNATVDVAASPLVISQRVVGVASSTDGRGFWQVAADGGVFSFGDALFHGSAATTRLNQPIVGMAATADGGGYWLVGADGGVFSFGDASFYGSTASTRLNQPIVGIATTPDGAGYWLAGADGGVFSFGDAPYLGSAVGLPFDSPIVGIAAPGAPTKKQPNAFSISGTISGLSGTVELQQNGGDGLAITANGVFSFPTPVAEGATYDVTVLTQPQTQTCTVVNGSGTVGSSNITDVSVACSTNVFTVGGTISGLSGTVVLQNNGGDDLTVDANGSFTFSTPVAEGATYNVTVLSQPASQTCTVTNGSGPMGGSDVTNVSVNCIFG